MKQNILDPQLGKIEITWRQQNKRIICRYKNGIYTITVPIYSSMSTIIESIDSLRPKLLTLKTKEIKTKFFDHNFRIDIPQLKIEIIESSKYKTAHISYKNKKLTLEINSAIIYKESVQAWIKKAIVLEIKEISYKSLYLRTTELATNTNTKITNIKVGKAKRSWGSCNSLGNITLSCFTFLLPDHLRDYIIYHELAHRREMNHSKHFYTIWNSYVGANFLLYQQEIKKYTTDIECFSTRYTEI